MSCGVLNVFAQSCPVCRHQTRSDLSPVRIKAQTGFLKPGLEEASNCIKLDLRIGPVLRLGQGIVLK